MVLLGRNGIVNQYLTWLGLTHAPLPLLYNQAGVVIGMSYVLLPYMVLTVYSVMRGIDPGLVRAAHSLGASRMQAFRRVFLPLSLPGVLAGSLLVFSLAISSFVVPILVGGFKVHVLPMVVYEQILSVFDWPFGAANAFVLLVISVALIGVYIKVTERALRGIV